VFGEAVSTIIGSKADYDLFIAASQPLISGIRIHIIGACVPWEISSEMQHIVLKSSLMFYATISRRVCISNRPIFHYPNLELYSEWKIAREKLGDTPTDDVREILQSQRPLPRVFISGFVDDIPLVSDI